MTAATTKVLACPNGSTTVAGYGGPVDPVTPPVVDPVPTPPPVVKPVPTPKGSCNQGLGNGSEGKDPGKSQPHGGSNDEYGRTRSCNKNEDIKPVLDNSKNPLHSGDNFNKGPVGCSKNGSSQGGQGSSSPNSPTVAGYGGPVDPQPLPIPPASSPTGTTVAGYGGPVDPQPLPIPTAGKCHYNQGIGNGSEGKDPGKSQPHGGSNDEYGRTPGAPTGKCGSSKGGPSPCQGKDSLTGSKSSDPLVGSKGSDSFNCKNSKNSKGPIVPDVIVSGKTTCSSNKGVNVNFFSLGCLNPKSPDPKTDKNCPITFSNTSSHPLNGSSLCGSNFRFHA